MSRLEGSPEAMRDFAGHVSGFCQELRDRLARVSTKARDLGSGDWTDENYKRLMERLEPLVASMGRSLDELESDVANETRSLADRYDELANDS